MKNINNIKSIVIFLLYLLIIIFISCNDNILTPENSDNLFPLKIGNAWTFQFPVWLSTGDTLVAVEYKVTKKKEVGGKEYFGFNHKLPFFPSNWIIENLDSIFIRQNEKGDIMLLVDSTEYPYFVFSNNFVEGDTNLVRSKIKDVRYFYMTESINATVDTPIGQFTKCHIIFNYFPQAKGSEHRIWFTPGYGPVKIYYPELDVTYQLVKINVHNN
jgi:hypothetical protein